MTQTKDASFLNEFQQEGKKTSSTGKFAIEDWESALDTTTKIATPERKKEFHETDWNNVPRYKMTSYCIDCRKIITPDIKMIRRHPKKVCPICKSFKVASGREDALVSFYRIDEKK